MHFVSELNNNCKIKATFDMLGSQEIYIVVTRKQERKISIIIHIYLGLKCKSLLNGFSFYYNYLHPQNQFKHLTHIIDFLFLILPIDV